MHLKLTKSHGAPRQSVFVSGYFNLVKIWHLITLHHRWFQKQFFKLFCPYFLWALCVSFFNRHTQANTQRWAFVQLTRKWGVLLSLVNSKIIPDKTSLTAKECFLNGRVIKILIWGHPAWIHSTASRRAHGTQLYNIPAPSTAFVLLEKRIIKGNYILFP